jgi:N-acetylglucosamine-6-phosphate deacetylase
MTKLKAISGARIFDGENWHEEKSLIVENGRIETIADNSGIPADAETIDYTGTLVVPGFIDLQVNGGGGVLFNEVPTIDGIRQIIKAHARFGTTLLMPTLITDTKEITGKALEAGRQAARERLPGFLGLHLEGPHLSIARKGAHDPALIRPMDGADLAALTTYGLEVGTLLTTVAPESVTRDQVHQLTQNGVLISLGHSNVSAAEALSYMAAGARLVTHLFNAMSPLTNREPGLVGAALDCGSVYAGMIADGFHVDPISMNVAIKAKTGPAKILLVTDAMATIGTNMTGFTLNGRQINRAEGRLTLSDGTLAGADIDMLSSVRLAVEKLGLTLEEALRMASTYPAEAARVSDQYGKLLPGFAANFVVLDRELSHIATWIDGNSFSA